MQCTCYNVSRRKRTNDAYIYDIRALDLFNIIMYSTCARGFRFTCSSIGRAMFAAGVQGWMVSKWRRAGRMYVRTRMRLSRRRERKLVTTTGIITFFRRDGPSGYTHDA